MVREEIFSHLRDLKLSGMLAVYDEVLEEGRRSRSTADKTLLRLFLRYGKNSKQIFPGAATAKTWFRLASRRLSRRTGLAVDVY